MLGPDSRSVLRELLRPPVGSTLDIAVATTFTLDLTSALVAPLSFASFELSGSDDPVAILEAVRSAAERVSVFTQVGHVRVPTEPSDLMAFLEPMVHEVNPARPGYLFHPKVWVLRFSRADGEISYRLVCGTRNLTDDVSWDAVIALDGVIESQAPQRRNRPLADFVRALPDMAVRPLAVQRSKEIHQLADELRTVTWELPDKVNAVEFHALGVGYPNAAAEVRGIFDGARTIAVSPFVDDTTVDDLWNLSNEFTLISRPEALEALHPDTVEDLTCRILDPLAGLEGATADSDTGGRLGGLHAKIYVAQHGHDASLMIGSANATNAGLDDRNVEFLVELQAKRSVFGVDQFLGDGAEFLKVTNEYQPTGGAVVDPVEDARRKLSAELRRIATTTLTARVARVEQLAIDIVSAGDVDVAEDMGLSIGLLTVGARAVVHEGGRINAHIELDDVADVTAFVRLEVSTMVGATRVKESTIVRADLVGDPPGRLDEVIARQIDTPEKFLRFLMLMLAINDASIPPPIDGSGGGDLASFFGSQTGIFESLLRALAEHPSTIDDLDRLIERLRSTERGRAALPDGFEPLWEVVLSARKQMVGSA